jgi:hypothetical protein
MTSIHIHLLTGLRECAAIQLHNMVLNTRARTWLREQETSGTGTALVSRWRKAVDVDGDYAEK